MFSAKSALLSVGLSVISLIVFAPASAHAGLTGCSSQPQPGDGYDCRLGGPYGPGTLGQGNNCVSQCNSLKDCLNANPQSQSVCDNLKNNLGVCVQQARRNKVQYLPGVGCSVVDDRVIASAEEEILVPRVLSASGMLKSQAVRLQVAVEEEVCSEEMLAENEPAALLQGVVASVLHVAPHMVQRDTHFYRDLGATWEDMRVIANELGGYYGVQIEDSVVDHMNTARDIESCAQRIRAGR